VAARGEALAQPIRDGQQHGRLFPTRERNATQAMNMIYSFDHENRYRHPHVGLVVTCVSKDSMRAWAQSVWEVPVCPLEQAGRKGGGGEGAWPGQNGLKGWRSVFPDAMNAFACMNVADSSSAAATTLLGQTGEGPWPGEEIASCCFVGYPLS
jgi:hypothetical protein